ncbi:hypothetical protein [Lacunimicrobium album]
MNQELVEKVMAAARSRLVKAETEEEFVTAKVEFLDLYILLIGEWNDDLHE